VPWQSSRPTHRIGNSILPATRAESGNGILNVVVRLKVEQVGFQRTGPREVSLGWANRRMQR
jgi:hypothetical protein